MYDSDHKYSSTSWCLMLTFVWVYGYTFLFTINILQNTLYTGLYSTVNHVKQLINFIDASKGIIRD